MRIEYVTDIELLREVGEHWLSEHRGKEYGFDVSVDAILADSKEWLSTGMGAVIALVDDETGYVGFMSIYHAPAFMGITTVAYEKYWYIMPDYRFGAILMFNEAKKWAKKKGASHLIMSASAMASDMYEKLCIFYERLSMQVFEKSYICEV